MRKQIEIRESAFAFDDSQSARVVFLGNDISRSMGVFSARFQCLRVVGKEELIASLSHV